MNITVTSADWGALAPLTIVAVTALVVLLADLAAPKNLHRGVAIGLAVAGLLAAGIVCATQYGHDYAAFGGAFILGGFSVVFQEIILIGALGSVVLYGTTGERARVYGSIALLLWSTCGAMLMAGAGSLMTIFLGLELLSLALYCLCGVADRPTAREAALKYLILSSMASGFLLYGMALLFGASGSVALADLVNPALAGNPLTWMGAGLFLIGIAFKLSLVPFHAWSPDVYEGAPLPVTAFMSVVTKAGTLAVFARFIYAALPAGVDQRLLLPVWIIAAVSMIAGNVGMLAQHDLKRLIAYSGIAQVGYILAAFAGGSALGLRYAIYYLVAYTFMNLGAFGVAALLSDEHEQGSRLANYRGLGFRRPVTAALMTFFLLAMAGLPPTAGFLGKILILSTSVDSGYAWLGAVLIVGTAISLYAYAKVIRAMYSRDPHAHAHDVHPFAPLAWISAAACFALILIMTFYPYTPSNVLPLVR
ncbi:MAG TPA: NADH-quinone oxidoreductase subunit N [Candidatus Baltobacteraceae bacterium]|nr:NADH-quinone oxidoreductase subunit N [Candidatus Baltobacteraceae bacterium]